MNFEPKDVLAIIIVLGGFVLKALGLNSTVDILLTMVVSSYYTYEFTKKRLEK